MANIYTLGRLAAGLAAAALALGQATAVAAGGAASNVSSEPVASAASGAQPHKGKLRPRNAASQGARQGNSSSREVPRSGTSQRGAAASAASGPNR
jgi:hypothetical protein